MVAHMDAEALARTLEQKVAWFWSRSRGRHWMKGESSGNVLRIQRILVDCDQDTLLLECVPAGPACHTGAQSCFFSELDGEVLRPVTT